MALHPRLAAFEGLVDSFQDGVLVSDSNAVIVIANAAAERLFRVPRSALLLPVHEFTTRFGLREGTDKAPSRVATALEGRDAIAVEQSLGSGDDVRHIRTSASPIRDEAGAVVGAVLTISEISDVRRHAQEEADHEREDQFRALFEAMPQLGWAANPDGWIYHFNQRWHDYTGMTSAELEGWGWEAVHDPGLLPVVVARWKAALEAGEPFEMSFTLRRHDGVRRWFLTRATPFRDAAGKIVRWVGINTDVHELREARRRLEALTVLAGELSNARTPTQVADVVVAHGMVMAGADTCTLYLYQPAVDELVLIGERGAPPEIVEKIRVLSAVGGNAVTFETIRSGASLWAESESDYLALFPALATQKATGPRAKAFWSMPLIVEGQPVGLLGMGFYSPRQFSSDERRFVETFTRQCAQALLRAVRLEREDEANRSLTTTLRSIGDAVIATDTSGRVTFMNPVAERLTGWPAVEARGKPLDQVFRIFSEKTGEPTESPVTKVLREGTIVGLANHTVLRARDGRIVPIDDSGAPIADEQGDLYGVVLVFRDVTREKLAEVRRNFLASAGEALTSSLDYKATLSSVAHLAVPELADWCAVDIMEPGASKPLQLAVAHADPAKIVYAEQIGKQYPPDPEARTGAPEVIRSGKAQLYSEIPAALLEAGARDAEHLRIIRELRLESAMVVPLRGRGRTLGAITFIYADSGRRYTSEDLEFAEEFARRAALAIENAMAFSEVERARRDAEVANRTKDEFLATVSHELRTPLNAILGWTITLRSRRPPNDIDRALAIVERNARAQARIVEDVLDVSRIITGKLSLTVGLMNLAETLVAAAEAVAPAAEAKDVTLTIEASPDGLDINADPDRLRQVVWNLLSNAVKFTPKGGVVLASAHREGSDVYLRVSDTGEGIAPNVLPAVFEPFRQADASTTRRHGGLGLGLAIVHQLVTAHGGTVSAESEGLGRGAAFTVRLPARITPVSTLVAAGVERGPRATNPHRPLPRLDGAKLLVVDDEEEVRVLLAAVLQAQGAEVHLASSVADALAQFAHVRPHVVVSDIGMPSADGYELIRALRALPEGHAGTTKAVALTAYARPEDVERVLSAGYDRHIAKPVDPFDLATLIGELYRASRRP